jgi:ABC-type branched-subunit amino acid transport system ATPase component
MGLVRTNQRIQDFESLGILDSMLLSLASPSQESVRALFSETTLHASAHPAVMRYLEAFRFSDPSGYALSAGEKKLLDIIRCLLLKPKFLLMDEPTVGLPQDQTDKVMEVVRAAAQDEGMAVVIIEHDLDLIWNVCEYIHFMADGRILTQGTPEEVRTSRMVRDKYMGEGDA